MRRTLDRAQRMGPPPATAVPSRLVACAALSILLLIAAVLFFHQTRGTTFTFDEWVWVLHRRGGSLSTFLEPHNGHLSLVPIVIYKVLFATAGLGHYAPYRAVVIAAHLTCVLLLFVYARQRVGPAIALGCAALMLFLGPAWQNFLWPFQTAWLISIAGGLGALLLLDRHDRRGDVGACALVTCSLASSGVGLAVAIGVAVDILARRDRGRRAWIVLGPLAIYVLWWVAYQNTTLTLQAVEQAPGFVGTAASSTFAALAGLAGSTVPFGSGTLLVFGPPLAASALLVLAGRLRHRANLTPRVAALVALVGGFWLLAAVGRSGVAAGYSSRYLYVGGIFILVLGVELAPEVRLTRAQSALALAVLIAVIVSNIGALSDGGAYQRSESQLVAADLGALDIGRPLIPPGYQAADFPGFGVVLDAKSYFAAEHAIGTPAASITEIESDPDGVRHAVDAELIAIHRIALTPPSGSDAGAGTRPRVDSLLDGGLSATGTCLAFTPSVLQPAGALPDLRLTLPAAGVRISTGGGSAAVSIRRFSSQFSGLGSIAAGGSAAIVVAPDLSAAAWHVQINPDTRVTVCGLR